MELLPPNTLWSNECRKHKRFKNIGVPEAYKMPISSFLKYMITHTFKRKTSAPRVGYTQFQTLWHRKLNVPLALEQLRQEEASPSPPKKDHTFWIGHATSLLCLQNGVNIILDPIFSERCSPLSFAGPKRKYPPATSIPELPPIHLILVSHNHYDHLDKQSVLQIYHENKSSKYASIKLVVPREMEKLLMQWDIPLEDIVIMNWWEERVFTFPNLHPNNNNNKVIVGCTPAQHWGKHSMSDNNKHLWCGWLVGWMDNALAEKNLSGSNMNCTPDGFPLPHKVGSILRKKDSSSSPHQHPGDDDDEIQEESYTLYATDGTPVYVTDLHRFPRSLDQILSSFTAGVVEPADDHYSTASHSPISPPPAVIPTLSTVDWSALQTFYFTGDTAFNSILFEMIRIRFFPLSLLPEGGEPLPRVGERSEAYEAQHRTITMAALPIGAYSPRWFMSTSHIDPQCAARIAQLLNVKAAYAVHWATFELSEEAMDDPPQELEETGEKRCVAIPTGGSVSF